MVSVAVDPRAAEATRGGTHPGSGSRAPALPALTGLRFYAALAIVVVHFGVHLVPMGPLRTIAAHGDIGVSLFFVLSGFILAYTYVNESGVRTPARAFWIARFARVYPIYVFALLVALAPAIWTGQLTWGVALSTLTLTQSWRADWATAWNPPAWSLSAEACFYLCFPVIGAYLSRTRMLALLVLLALMWVTSLALIFVASTRGVAYETAVYHPLFRLPEFAFGVGLGIVFTRSGPWPRSAMVAPGAVLALLVLVMTLGPALARATLNAGLLTPVLGALLFALAGGRGRLAASLAAPISISLGEASYALYLLHVPVWFWLTRVEGGSSAPDGYPLPFFLLYVALCVAVSLVAHRFIETPARIRLRALVALGSAR